MAGRLAVFAISALVVSAPAAAGGVAPLHGLPLDAPIAQLGPRSAAAEEAEHLMAEGEFEQAVKVLQRGLAEPDVTDDVLVELYRLMGLAQLYLGNEEKARDAYEKLLQARPDYELPRSAPPKIRELYGKIKEDIRKRRVRPVTITAEPIPDQPGGEAIEVRARVDDLALGSKPKLYYRRAGAQSYSSVDFRREKGGPRNEFKATIPAYEVPAEARAYDLEYYLEVADAAQRRLAGKGDAYNPNHFSIRPIDEGVVNGPEEDGPWYSKPWVWIAAGAVVLAGGATAAVLASSQPTGNVTVKIRVNP